MRKMQPFARQRAALPGKTDNYIPVEERILTKNWHDDGRAPKVSQILSEDFHFMMRCLYLYLPAPATPTNSSKTEDRFAHVYVMKFGQFAIKNRYVRQLQGVRRLPQEQGFPAVHAWLEMKVLGKRDPFGWRDYALSPQKIHEVCFRASQDWWYGWRA